MESSERLFGRTAAPRLTGQGVPPDAGGVANMQLSPLDVRKQTFKRTLRGVDPEEVRMFLELVASEFEKVVQDNAMMAEKLSYQEERLDEYRDLEKSLRNSLITAERIATESREASERESERITLDAHARAERILEDSRERLQRLVQDIEAVQSKKDLYVRRFRAMLEGQLSVLQEHEEQFDGIDAIEATAQNLLSKSGSQIGQTASHYSSRRETSAYTEPIEVREDEGPEALPYEGEGLGRGVDDTAEPEQQDYPGDDDRRQNAQEELPFAEQSEPYDPIHVAAGTGEAGFFEIQEQREGFFEFDPRNEGDPPPSQ